MRVSAKVDYAVRAAVELGLSDGERRKCDDIAAAQEVPSGFLENILHELRSAGLVHSRRGGNGGYWLARPAAEISVADIFRAVEGPLATVNDARPEETAYPAGSATMQQLWIALRTSLRDVLEVVTIADLAAAELPDEIVKLTEDPEDWIGR
ncbi:MAG TPA: Rrf2 family transcriptional regulator [Solirubrobacterales bacterium]|nr:Rrf2 family transcriptional regulator [Solirubrobacterales bacterium]